MTFIPTQESLDSIPLLREVSQGSRSWTPLFSHTCSFPPEIFKQVMLNLIRNPNINSKFLFRADISLDQPYTPEWTNRSDVRPEITQFESVDLKRVMVRVLIPRNPQVDKPLDQTCLLYERSDDSGCVQSLVIYLPHISSAADMPYYHPEVRGIGFRHTYSPQSKEGKISIDYSFFESQLRSERLDRTAQRLLAVLYKHGQGQAAGYVKKVNHDTMIPQAVVQNTYARLKLKYAKTLINGWAESTDPGKHVFEDLSIAAFLIELWAKMYKDSNFPGFVDIGCGNGLLVHVLLEEGYPGWGFDARARKSWATYGSQTQSNLKEQILVPATVQKIIPSQSEIQNKGNYNQNPSCIEGETKISPITPDLNMSPHHAEFHDGVFPKGTFIISNHADELTPWTPILANISHSPFIMIPCCSHALSGARFRAPNIKEGNKTSSAYASLVGWVWKIGQDCGWEVEKEMLRIPSTRNTALIGRRRVTSFEDIDVSDLINRYGGADGWEENALKLSKSTTRGH